MRTLFVYVKCQLGKAYDVASKIVEMEGVSEVYSISGEYDLLVKCYIRKDMDAGRFVIDSIQSVAGVRDTSTTIALNAFS